MFDKLHYTTKELRQMTKEELSSLRQSLGVYVDTPQEQDARLLNRMLGDELDTYNPCSERHIQRG
jgi:hypothetical protein